MFLLRFVTFVGTLAIIGGGVFALLVVPRAGRLGLDEPLALEMRRRSWRLVGWAGVMLVLVAGVRLAVHSAQGGLGDAGMAGLPATPWGKGWLLGTLGAAASWMAAQGEGDESLTPVLWTLAAAALSAGLPLGGHASELASTPATIADAVHGFAAGGWVGTLAALLWGSGGPLNRASPQRHQGLAAVVRAFSPVALFFAGAAALTGTVNALGFLGAGEGTLQSGYARVLGAKLVVLGAVAALGAYNWRVVTPRLGQPQGTARLQRSARIEVLLALLVLLLTALLVALPAPALVA